MTKEDAINVLIQGTDTNKISDGYHTFGELYSHRIELFIQLCRFMTSEWTGHKPWRSRNHSDGSSIDGWFIMGIDKGFGNQITYHIPIDKWDDCSFAQTLDAAPKWDGHTSADVLERLKTL